MRIWHTSLLPKLCQKHLCAMWRESLGAYSIITRTQQNLDKNNAADIMYSILSGERIGYLNHPATQEYINAPGQLYTILSLVRQEMLSRGYHPKPLPQFVKFPKETIKQWQTLEEQIEHLKTKKCKCNI